MFGVELPCQSLPWALGALRNIIESQTISDSQKVRGPRERSELRQNLVRRSRRRVSVSWVSWVGSGRGLGAEGRAGGATVWACDHTTERGGEERKMEHQSSPNNRGPCGSLGHRKMDDMWRVWTEPFAPAGVAGFSGIKWTAELPPRSSLASIEGRGSHGFTMFYYFHFSALDRAPSARPIGGSQWFSLARRTMIW